MAHRIMTAEEFRDLALALEVTVEIGHFDRRAFRARRIFASLAPDGRSRAGVDARYCWACCLLSPSSPNRSSQLAI
jgi:hypothetical protein